MLDAAYLKDKFSVAMAYNAYVATGDEEQRRRWIRGYAQATLSPAQHSLIKGFARPMSVLVLSGIWCGDCAAQGPMLARIAEANPKSVQLRFLDRDADHFLSDHFRMNDGARVPTAIFMSEDFVFCSAYGDRTLTRYRGMIRRQIPALADSMPQMDESQELDATLQEWINEFERIQWALRLSPRMRQKYGD